MIGALYALRIEGKPFDKSALPLNWQPQGELVAQRRLEGRA